MRSGSILTCESAADSAFQKDRYAGLRSATGITEMIIGNECPVLEYKNIIPGRIYPMSYTNKIILCCLLLACCSSFIVIPVHAFTANSLDITVNKNGDAVATFRFTLDGIIENSIPQSVLEDQLKKGLTTSAEPPELLSMDRSSAVLLMKKFADTSDVPTGTEYRTATMDFKKAEIALQNSAISSAVSADFSPDTVSLTFPDSYKREFSNVDVLPAVFHTVIDPSKTPQTTAPGGAVAQPGVTTKPAKGSINVTSTPLNVKVSLDSGYIGEAPAVFPEISPGVHGVEFSKEGFESVRKNVTVIAGKTTNVMVVLKYIPPVPTEDTSSSPDLVWIVLIIALVAIAGGGYYFWSEKKKKERREEEDTEPEKSSYQAPAGKDMVSKDTGGRKPEIRKPEIKNTVIKVTILKDIPDKDTGDKDTRDAQK